MHLRPETAVYSGSCTMKPFVRKKITGEHQQAREIRTLTYKVEPVSPGQMKGFVQAGRSAPKRCHDIGHDWGGSAATAKPQDPWPLPILVLWGVGDGGGEALLAEAQHARQGRHAERVAPLLLDLVHQRLAQLVPAHRDGPRQPCWGGGACRGQEMPSVYLYVCVCVFV